MELFPFGHATHPRWEMAASLVLAQLRAQMESPGHARNPSLGLLYVTDHYAAQAQDILSMLAAELPMVSDWAGTVGVGVAATNAEYFDEPALAVMLCALPRDQYRVFSGLAPLPASFQAHAALVHADGNTPDLGELVGELADRTATGYLFGGLAASRGPAVQIARTSGASATHRNEGVLRGGLSGVAFGEQVGLVSRVTQGCQPVAPQRRITAARDNVVLQLDGRPALEVLLQDLAISLDEPEVAMPALRATLVGLTEADSDLVGRAGNFGADVVVRHIIGLDPARQGVALADQVGEGMRLAFCRRDPQAARADLVRICSEIREELEPQELPLALANTLAAPQALSAPHPGRRMAGAIYVSCAGRGGPHFGGPSAELQVVRRALGDVPLVGFFAGGEIARSHLYGYTGVLTVFT